ARGSVQGLWSPHPDREQQLGELRLGIQLDGVTRWLDDETFVWEQSYADGSMLLRTVCRTAGLEVTIDDLVHPTEPALVRRVSCPERGSRLGVRFRALEGVLAPGTGSARRPGRPVPFASGGSVGLGGAVGC